MGIHASAHLYYGIVIDNDYIYDHYVDVEDDSEWKEYEYPSEALEADFERRCKGTNLGVANVGSYEDEEAPWLLVLQSATIRGDEHGAVPFDWHDLNIGPPTGGYDGMRVANLAGLDWTQAKWHLCWSLG